MGKIEVTGSAGFLASLDWELETGLSNGQMKTYDWAAKLLET